MFWSRFGVPSHSRAHRAAIPRFRLQVARGPRAMMSRPFERISDMISGEFQNDGDLYSRSVLSHPKDLDLALDQANLIQFSN
jgi:hypothetical protein